MSGRQAALLVVGVHHSYFQSVLNFVVHFCLFVNSSVKSDFKMLFFQQVVVPSGRHTLSVMGLGVLLCHEQIIDFNIYLNRVYM